jgi:hypothetical protein
LFAKKASDMKTNDGAERNEHACDFSGGPAAHAETSRHESPDGDAPSDPEPPPFAIVIDYNAERRLSITTNTCC